MKRLKIILMIVLFFITTNVFAINDCTNDEMKRLRELANNVKITYDYKIDFESLEDETIIVFYNIKINNLPSDLQIYFQSIDDDELRVYSKEELESLEFAGSSKEKFYLYSYTNNLCTDELIKRIDVNFKPINPYYYFNKEKCLDNKDFKYCQEFMSIDDMSFAEIDALLNKENKTNFDKTQNSKYFILIISVLVIIVVTIIVIKIIVTKKRKKKEDYL